MLIDTLLFTLNSPVSSYDHVNKSPFKCWLMQMHLLKGIHSDMIALTAVCLCSE